MVTTAVLGAATVPVATSSGTSLAARVGNPTSSGTSLAARVGNPGEHAELGQQLLWFALPLLVLVTALVVVERRARRAADGPAGLDGPPRVGRVGRARGAGTVPTVLAVLAVVAAVASSVQVYRIGESGARVVWGDVPAAR